MRKNQASVNQVIERFQKQILACINRTLGFPVNFSLIKKELKKHGVLDVEKKERELACAINGLLETKKLEVRCVNKDFDQNQPTTLRFFVTSN